MSRERQFFAAGAAVAATLIGLAGVANERLSLLLIACGLLIALRLSGLNLRRSARGNR
jgi:hypothetical protein